MLFVQEKNLYKSVNLLIKLHNALYLSLIDQPVIYEVILGLL